MHNALWNREALSGGEFDSPILQVDCEMTFNNIEEMEAATGTIDDNTFIIQVRKETESLKQLILELRTRI